MIEAVALVRDLGIVGVFLFVTVPLEFLWFLFLVLDNGTDRITDSAAMRDYRPVLTFGAGQRFTHGYRRSTIAPVVLASYRAPAPRPPWDFRVSSTSRRRR